MQAGLLISRRRMVVLLLPLVLRAQQEPTFSAGVKVVNVLATVRDKRGQLVRDLTKDDFVLEEDGRTQTIRYFSQQTDLPLTLGLLIDTSASQQRVLGAECHASSRFFQQVLREDKDKAFVIHFDREAELLQDLTSSRQDLQATLRALEQRGREGLLGGTSLYDAVLLASDELMARQSGRKALIVLSDGVDVGSRVSLADSLAAAHRADALVYAIRFSGRSAQEGRKTFDRLSKETGGAWFEISSKDPLERTFSRIEEELRSQYNLGYTSSNTQLPPGFHKIRLTTKQKGLVVQAREGYYSN